MSRVVIGMDPHKRSATIEVIDEREQVLAQGRYETDSAGYQAMLAAGRRFSDRVWAVEGCAGIGRHIAQRLVADGETVLDVPAKLSARVRVFDTGQGRKTDPVDAHSVAVAGLRSPGLRAVAADDATVVLRLLVDRRDELGRARTETVSRIHHLLLEIIPGGAKKFLTRGPASSKLRRLRSRAMYPIDGTSADQSRALSSRVPASDSTSSHVMPAAASRSASSRTAGSAAPSAPHRPGRAAGPGRSGTALPAMACPGPGPGGSGR